MNREAWWATVHGIEKEEPDMTEQVNITYLVLINLLKISIKLLLAHKPPEIVSMLP